MSLKSTKARYGTVAISLHWLTALFIAVMLVTGFKSADSADLGAKAELLRVHLPIGLVILVLTALRIIWWLVGDTRPGKSVMPAWQYRSSRVVHILLYGFLLITLASGIGTVALSGAAPAIFGDGSVLMPDFQEFKPRGLHGLGVRVVVGLLVLHIGAALYHHFIKRDDVLRRMWFGN